MCKEYRPFLQYTSIDKGTAKRMHSLGFHSSHWVILWLKCYNLTFDTWTLKLIGLMTLPYTYYIPSLFEISQEMVSVEWWQGCHSWKLWKSNFELDIWPWKSIGYKILPKSNCIPSLVQICQEMVSVEWWQGCHSLK